jgi:hypothetical protein
MLLEYWQLLICKGTGVAYSLAPDFQHTIVLNEWPILDEELHYGKVKTIVSYDKQSGKVFKHGLGRDWHGTSKGYTVHKSFWYSKNWRNTLPPTLLHTCCKDFLSCLYDYLSVHIDKILPQWNQRAIEFVFSTPQSCTTDSRQDMESLIKAAGFGASSKHRIRMVSTAQAIISAVTLQRGTAELVLRSYTTLEIQERVLVIAGYLQIWAKWLWK